MNKSRLYTLLTVLALTTGVSAQTTPTSQMENIGRAPVVLKSSTNGNFISWRLLGTDDDDLTTFDILYNNNVLVEDLKKTNYVHTTGTPTGEYRIVAKLHGEAIDTTEAVMAWTEPYKTLKLNRPAKGAKGGTYSPNDCSVGDVDGDGTYELIVKWDPSNAQDNSKNGYTDNVILDCYRLSGEQLWRIDLGVNIRAGAHYTQFMVYDFDGDGRAELMCKTAPGSKDGKGSYVNQAASDATIRSVSNTKDWRNSSGRITGGQEYLTVFDGETGAAIHTIFYNPNRNQGYGGEADGSFNWGKPDGKSDTGSYGNRGERYLAAVAYLDGADENPCGVFCRGYYNYAFLWAVSFDGKQLHQRWLHFSSSKTEYSLTTYDANDNGTTQKFSNLKPTSGSGSGTMFANGNHNLSVADVDGDGCDEIVWGSATCDNNGRLLFGTGFGHGDAIHLSDLIPTRPGLEVFQVHEEKGTYSWDIHDAATGEIIHKGGNKGVDNGRGMAADIMAENPGFEFWSADNDTTKAKTYGGLNEKYPRSATTREVLAQKSSTINYRIYWDGDLQDELLDGNKIDKWNGNGFSRLYINGKNPYDYNGSSTCNGSKNTPCLQADILGDWREEIILWSSSDNATLNIFTTNEPTDFMLPTLMHDHVYRMGIAWQNVAYNQPPHLGFYLPDYFNPQLSFVQGSSREQTVELGNAITPIVCRWRHCASNPSLTSTAPDGTIKLFNLPLPGFTNTRDTDNHLYTIEGTPEQLGDYTFVLKLSGNNSMTIEETLTVHVVEDTGINSMASDTKADARYYDLQGRRVNQPTKGIYIVNGKKIVRH